MAGTAHLPEIGSFLAVDPIQGGSANAYDYCNGDPISCSDLTGNIPSAIVDFADMSGGSALASELWTSGQQIPGASWWYNQHRTNLGGIGVCMGVCGALNWHETQTRVDWFTLPNGDEVEIIRQQSRYNFTYCCGMPGPTFGHFGPQLTYTTDWQTDSIEAIEYQRGVGDGGVHADWTVVDDERYP